MKVKERKNKKNLFIFRIRAKRNTLISAMRIPSLNKKLTHIKEWLVPIKSHQTHSITQSIKFLRIQMFSSFYKKKSSQSQLSVKMHTQRANSS